MTTPALWSTARAADPITARWYFIEFNRRLHLPTALHRVGLVGIPLDCPRKRREDRRLCADDHLVFAYYSASLIGVSLARQGKLSPTAGVLAGRYSVFSGRAFLLWQADAPV